jgi:hypothetical protein
MREVLAFEIAVEKGYNGFQLRTIILSVIRFRPERELGFIAHFLLDKIRIHTSKLSPMLFVGSVFIYVPARNWATMHGQILIE